MLFEDWCDQSTKPPTKSPNILLFRMLFEDWCNQATKFTTKFNANCGHTDFNRQATIFIRSVAEPEPRTCMA
jgi:hypothetical protein